VAAILSSAGSVGTTRGRVKPSGVLLWLARVSVGQMTRRRLLVPGVILLVTWSMTTHGKFSTSGDEPHYLIMAESLVTDGDLDLQNNYRDGDARQFGVSDLQAGPHVRRTPSGALRSVHDIGLPIAIVPAYVVATRVAAWVPDSWLARVRQSRGLFAYSLVSLCLMAATAWGSFLLAAGLARQVPGGRADLVVLVMALTPPVLSHAFLVFPETVAFVVVCGVMWLWLLDEAELSPGRVLLVLATVACMPWLHRKYSPLVLGLLVVLAVRHLPWLRRQSRPVRVTLALTATLPHAALYAWTAVTWGTAGGPHMLDAVPFSASGLPTGALGLLFDRERGLVGYAPVYLLTPACLALAWRNVRWLMLPMTAFFLPMAAFVTWDAGFSPAARFLVPLTPIVAVAAALALAHRPLRRAFAPILVLQVVIGAVVWQRPRLLWPRELGTNDALEAIPLVGPVYERMLPTLHTGDPPSAAWLAIGLVAAMNVVVVRRARRQSGDP